MPERPELTAAKAPTLRLASKAKAASAANARSPGPAFPHGGCAGSPPRHQEHLCRSAKTPLASVTPTLMGRELFQGGDGRSRLPLGSGQSGRARARRENFPRRRPPALRVSASRTGLASAEILKVPAWPSSPRGARPIRSSSASGPNRDLMVEFPSQAPVAQRIERCPPEAKTGVQFTAGALQRSAPPQANSTQATLRERVT